MYDAGECLFLARTGGLVEAARMSNTDAHQGFGLEMTLYVDHERRGKGNDLDTGMFSRFRDDCPGNRGEFVQC